MEDLVLTGDDSASHAAVQNQYPDQKQQLWQRPTLWRRRLMTANPNTGRMNQLVSASDTLPPFLRPLDFTKKENAESSALFEETATDSQTQNEIDESDFVLSAITQPLIPERAWQALTGREFQDHPELLEKLAAMGEAVARDDSSRGGEWIEWHAYGSSSSSSSPDVTKSLQEGDIHVWTGKCVSANTKSDAGNNNPLQQQYFGAQLPVIKTRSIIPLSVHDMVELLLDSSRVQLYNPWSLGRRDCWVAVATAGTLDAASLIVTKIVKNRVQPPLGSKAMVSTTLLHARPALSNDGSWVLVSRSLGHHGSALFSDSQNDDETAGRSDILLGVNLLEPVSDDSCILTAVTHVHSAAVPTLLAERLGVQSAIKFVKDMRRLKQAANLTAARSGEPSSATDRNEPSAINS